MTNLPNDIDSEQALLGCFLLDGNFFSKVADMQKNDFFDQLHQEIFSAAKSLFEQRKNVDHVTIASFLNNQKINFSPDYLADLQNFPPLPTHILYYAEKVKEQSQKRRLILTANEISKSAQDANKDAETLLSEGMSRILGLFPQNNSSLSLFELAEKAYEERNQTGTIFTGNESIDKRTKGIRDGKFCVLAAYSGTGKTTFSLQIIRNLVKNGKRVVFYSLEMKETDVFNIFRRILKHNDEKEDICYSWPLSIVSGKRRWFDIYADVIQRDSKPDVIFIDFAQIIDVPGKTEYERMQNLATSIQGFTQDTNITTFLLSQVATESMKNDNGIVNAKGGGDIFALSDYFFEIRRNIPEEEEARSNNQGTLIELERSMRIAKNRFGLEGKYPIYYDSSWGKGLYLNI